MVHFPPYYRRPGWQRFFAGVILGMFIGWLFFLYQFGAVHEKLVVEIKKQQAIIQKHETTINILQSDQNERNEENKKKLTVQEVKVYFQNDHAVKLNELTLHELRSAIENELKSVKNKNIETVSNSKDLLKQTIENKTFVINEKKYQITINELHLYTTLEIYVNIILV